MVNISDDYERELKLQSKTIDWLRFPMALMVIFIHQDPEFLNCENNKSGLLFNIIASAGSQVLLRVAVPLFF